MASGTRFRSRDRSREQGSSAPRSQRSAPPARAQGQTGALHLKVRPGQSGSFRLQRIVLLEIAAAALLVGWIVGPFALMPAAVVAVALVLLAFVRRRGRSLPEWLATARALRARQRRAASTPIPPGTEPGLAPAVECDPGLRTSAYSARDRRPVGVIGDGTFVTAVLQVEADATALRAEQVEQPLPWGWCGTRWTWTTSIWSRRRSCCTHSPRPRCTCPSSPWPSATTRRSRNKRGHPPCASPGSR